MQMTVVLAFVHCRYARADLFLRPCSLNTSSFRSRSGPTVSCMHTITSQVSLFMVLEVRNMHQCAFAVACTVGVRALRSVRNTTSSIFGVKIQVLIIYNSSIFLTEASLHYYCCWILKES